jgi:signal transduction histidine kinase
LLTIINDVMNISKIESGKEQLVMTTFELNALLQSLADMFLPKVEQL